MNKLLMFGLILGFLSGAGVVLAQGSPQESFQASFSDVAAVNAYRGAMETLKKDLKVAKVKVKQKNIALAQALGKLGPKYDPEEVKAVHKELLVAQQKLGAVELEGFLVHKKYVPSWQPAVQGRSISITAKQKPLN